MAVLVGIDEAGFGPILGPLVVSSAAFAIGDKLLKADLWQTLAKSVSQSRKHCSGRLVIADSKKVYSRALGIKHLRRTVLACLQILNAQLATLTELLQSIAPDLPPRLRTYPWYENADAHQLNAAGDDIAIAANLFKTDLRANRIELLALNSQCLDVAFYNKLVASAKNKSTVLFNTTARLIQAAFECFGCDNLHIILDRQGGRSHYRKNLALMFPDTHLKIIRETNKLSSYELADAKRKMRLHFAVGADSRFLPVALASMLSKYLRELLIEDINRFFLAHHNELKPTAGYYKDGRRFIREIKTSIPHLAFDHNQLIRSR